MTIAGPVTKLQRSFAYRVSKWFPSEFLRWMDRVSLFIDTGGASTTGIFNVRDYGASPSATPAQNSTAFAAAIAAKDAFGGGEILVPTGVYELASSVDLGTTAVILKGDGWSATGVDVFAAPFWSGTPYTGSVLKFVNDTDGVVCSIDFLYGAVRDLAILGPGVGTTKHGFFFSGPGAAFISLFNVAIGNFAVGYDPGVMELVNTFGLSVLGCITGILIDGAATSLTFFDCVVQYCTDAAIYNQGQLISWIGGVVQANTNGITLRPNLIGSPVQPIFESIYFENLPLAKNIIFDTAIGPIEEVAIRGCRMGANDAFSFPSGLNSVAGLEVTNCLMSFSATTIPANVARFLTSNTNWAGLTVNAATFVELNTPDGCVSASTFVATGAGPAQTGAVRLSNNTGIFARRTTAADVLIAKVDNVNELIVGDTGNVAHIRATAAAGSFYEQFGAFLVRVSNAIFGTPDSGNGQAANFAVQQNVGFLKVTSAANVGSIVAIAGSSGIGVRSIRVEVDWIARDNVIPASYAGKTIGTYRNSTTSTITIGGNGDAGLSTTAVDIINFGGGIGIRATLPAAYANDVDFTFDVRWIIN